MKKTFRKAIAVLLAVLMVAFSVPFSALAGTPDAPDMFGSTDYTVTKNRKWWVDDGVDTSLSKLQSAPEYWSYNSGEEFNTAGAWGLSFGNRFEDFATAGYEDHRNDYKPVVAATVSSQGTNAGMAEAVAKVKDKSDKNAIKNYAAQYFSNYYGFSDAQTTKSFEDVKEAGNILNPATLKAGQRIAITVEFGGFDVLQNGQFKGKFNKDYLKAAAYSSKPSRGDTWKAVVSGAAGCIADGTAFYPTAVAFAGNNVNVEDGTFYGAVTGKAAVAGDQSVSNYIGATESGDKPFGKYGIVSFVYSFEVLQDCDLSEVFTFDTDIKGTEFEPYYRTSLDGTGEPSSCNAANPELFLITHDDTDSTFANWALIWTDYAKDSTPETKTYTITFNDINGKVVDTQTVKEGETPTVPSTNTAAKTVSNNDGTHSVTTYAWPAVSAATGNTNYDEVATTTKSNCTLSYTELSKATILSGSKLTATCPDCDYVSNVTNDDKLDGTAYYAALAAAKAVDGSKYTEVSYARVTAALEANAQAKVEAMTSQSDVNAAAKALEDAVKGLEALPTTDVYTYTFADGSTKEVTVDKGAAPTAPANSASKVVDNKNGTHTSTSYAWEKTGDFTFAEKATANTANCTYGDYTTVTKSTIAKAGTEKATCSVCGHENVRDLAKLNGDAYYAALEAAKAVKADDYTADSYAKVTAALEANAQATVEAMTVQADVDAATAALENAVKGLVKVYTITFTNAAGTVVDTQKLAEGATPVVPATNTPNTATKSDNNAKTHSHTTYSWPAVSAVTANADYKEVAETVTENCTTGDPVVTQPTLDKEGSKVTSCTVCGQVLKTETIPALKGVNVTVTESKYGETTLNGETATAGKTTKVALNSDVTLTAKANSNAEFVGWKVANKLVSTDETYTFTAVADTTVTPVFTETAETFVVVFIDMYGNVVGAPQEVTSGTEIKEPTAPEYPGYKFDSWSLTADRIDALSEGTTITANYVKDATQTFTVKAAGATITVNGQSYNDVAENIPYDAKVTVSKTGTTSWRVGDVVVAYGDTYSFFCGSNMELTAVTDAGDATVKTQVAIASTDRPSASKPDVLFIATRIVADGETVVSQGFVYGKNAVASDLTLENVGKTASGANAGKVKVAYNSTNSDQFGLNYAIKAMTGTAAARAFIVTKDADGNVKTTYSEASLYNYDA
ncbi:MAG: hypothetical protein SOY48_09680 [Eubacterium sp.]|nr:hypothetical protein [Eubacterium sp.]